MGVQVAATPRYQEMRSSCSWGVTCARDSCAGHASASSVGAVLKRVNWSTTPCGALSGPDPVTAVKRKFPRPTRARQAAGIDRREPWVCLDREPISLTRRPLDEQTAQVSSAERLCPNPAKIPTRRPVFAQGDQRGASCWWRFYCLTPRGQPPRLPTAREISPFMASPPLRLPSMHSCCSSSSNLHLSQAIAS